MDLNTNFISLLQQLMPIFQNFGDKQNNNIFNNLAGSINKNNFTRNSLQNNNITNNANFSSNNIQALAYYPNELLGNLNNPQPSNNNLNINQTNSFANQTSEETSNNSLNIPQAQNNNMLLNLLKGFVGNSFGNGDRPSTIASLINKLGLTSSENGTSILSNLFPKSQKKESEEKNKNENKTKSIKDFKTIDEIEIEN